MTYLEKAQALYKQFGSGEVMEAFEKYYAEDVVMEEPSGKRIGKDVCRQYEEQFMSSLSEFHGMEVKNMASNENDGTVFIEVLMDLTFKDGNRVKMEEVAVQKWRGDQIVHERFYYNNG